jgi:hypothetical protein
MTTVCYLDANGEMMEIEKLVPRGNSGIIVSEKLKVYGCRMCKKGFIGIDFDKSSYKTGSRECIEFEAITSCEFTIQVSK